MKVPLKHSTVLKYTLLNKLLKTLLNKLLKTLLNKLLKTVLELGAYLEGVHTSIFEEPLFFRLPLMYNFLAFL